MAGMVVRDDDRMRSQGFVWHGPSGGYVNARSIDPATGKPYGGTEYEAMSAGAAAPLQAGAASHGVTLPGTLYRAKTQPGSTGGGSGGGSGGGGAYGGGAGASSSSSASNPNQMLQQKLEDLWRQYSSPQQQEAPQMPEETGTNQGDYAFLAESKERAGQRLQGGLRTLAAEMARRGITNSRIQEGNTRMLTRGAMADMAGDERALMQQKTARNQDIRDNNFDARKLAFTQNMARTENAQQRLSSLLQYYGMAY